MSPHPSSAGLSIPVEERRRLLQLARRAIHEAVLRGRPPEPALPAGVVARRCGVFVTLRSAGQLRGCIGKPESPHLLEETVAHCAVLAALNDPRFPALEFAELESIEIEISLVSPSEPARPEQVEAGRHGLTVSRGGFRGLLLPQVAIEYGWSRERFLAETCRKAGLEPGAWRDPETRLYVFTAEVFSEADFYAVEGEGAL